MRMLLLLLPALPLLLARSETAAAASPGSADGSFHGIDSAGDPIHVRIPPFEMRVPPESPHGQTELDLK
jgi:hypothetical protein